MTDLRWRHDVKRLDIAPFDTEAVGRVRVDRSAREPRIRSGIGAPAVDHLAGLGVEPRPSSTSARRSPVWVS